MKHMFNAFLLDAVFVCLFVCINVFVCVCCDQEVCLSAERLLIHCITDGDILSHCTRSEVLSIVLLLLYVSFLLGGGGYVHNVNNLFFEKNKITCYL